MWWWVSIPPSKWFQKRFSPVSWGGCGAALLGPMVALVGTFPVLPSMAITAERQVMKEGKAESWGGLHVSSS